MIEIFITLPLCHAFIAAGTYSELPPLRVVCRMYFHQCLSNQLSASSNRLIIDHWPATTDAKTQFELRPTSSSQVQRYCSLLKVRAQHLLAHR
ncbi:hypothetical protein C8R43DRAFT_1002678 [Mycena crocata]|nr:hypothetical protein C8R43DRAFT_1002678 [Mycena crocata]